MISVREALERMFALVRPTEVETRDLRQLSGRVLAEDAIAERDQPPFAASAMDGYAVRADDARPGARLQVIGEAPAGRQFAGQVASGQAVRIFTGAPVPDGANRIIIQEDVRKDEHSITLSKNMDENAYIRPAGSDFQVGDLVVAKGTLLAPAHVALLAAMNLPRVSVHRAPEVAILCTGDELVMPGSAPAPDQIIASNGFGLAALAEANGCVARLLPIAADTTASLTQSIELAMGADLILTVGGASVGDHDLVAPTLRAMGAKLEFQKIAMRPGKPVMAGTLGQTPVIGLPGNPVSAMVCGTIFVAPLLRAMQGRPATPVPRRTAPLATPIAANGAREHYMRATLGPDGIAAMTRQDSALLGNLARANALLVRPVGDPAQEIGATVEYVPL